MHWKAAVKQPQNLGSEALIWPIQQENMSFHEVRMTCGSPVIRPFVSTIARSIS